MTTETLAQKLADAKKAYYRAVTDGDPRRINLTDRAVREVEQAIRDDQNLTRTYIRSAYP